MPDVRRARLLFDAEDERDACGVGFVADVSGHRSHAVVARAVAALANLAHRGAVAADGKTGDGAGVLAQLPARLLRRTVESAGYHLGRDADLGAGMVFLPRHDAAAIDLARRIAEAAAARHRLVLFGWRPVPIDESALGEAARASRPLIAQILLGRPQGMDDAAFERTLYVARREMEKVARRARVPGFHVASMSCRTIVYKALVFAKAFGRVYADLRDPAFESALAVFHSRYSTNTSPSWPLAQPLRTLAHNGEINTLLGNLAWTRARERDEAFWQGGALPARPLPIVAPGGSDSMALDDVMGLLVASGRDVRHAAAMLVPDAWESRDDLDADARAFREYHACLMEPWDGPAAIAFTDGNVVGARLDRNGLRPARWAMTRDGVFVLASEAGVLGLDEACVLRKGSLRPGRSIAVDTRRRAVLDDETIDRELARAGPWRRWVAAGLVEVPRDETSPGPAPAGADVRRLQMAFGWTAEDVAAIVEPAARTGEEPVGSMGDDAPLAVLSRRPQPLHAYFKQRFAQVTNPPIDPLRERLVVSLRVRLGARGPVLGAAEESARLVALPGPVLLDAELAALRAPGSAAADRLRPVAIETTFDPAGGPGAMAQALRRVCERADAAVDRGHALVVLSDRGLRPDRAPIPMLLCTGAVHHHLIRTGRRMRASLVAETGEAWDSHAVACLVGYGASAVCPWLALRTVEDLAARGTVGHGGSPALRWRAAVERGIEKVMSKMGISVLASYHGAQLFEALGLGPAIVDLAFEGTPSRIGGLELPDVAEEVLARHAAAGDPRAGAAGKPGGTLPDAGLLRYRRDGETHAWSPPVVKALQSAVRGGGMAAFRAYAALCEARDPVALRDVVEMRSGLPAVALGEVEPESGIVRRFSTQAMSVGALGPEAHRTIGEAMNRIGARSNTGEGGEDPESWRDDGAPGSAAKVKQVASGRFGVTPEYLARAEEIEIKIAQGSKPGEGGQLPGRKVTALIARVRRAAPGVTLISPPPHHDIYSIEDLAQLVHDLRALNPRARVGVKLVAEMGVGVVASGVAKARADTVTVSGHDGGTGASPIGSVKNAGAPWEIGLAEAHQALVASGLRGRVRLRVDGGLRTGRDVVVAAMLGAEEFGFGTAALVAMGCMMTRQCHLDTCPVGIATQREDLRRRFSGTVESVVEFFRLLAGHVREILAALGLRRLDDVVGRADLLRPRLPDGHRKARTIDLGAVLARADEEGGPPRSGGRAVDEAPGGDPVGEALLRDARGAVLGRERVSLAYAVRNTDRSVGARLCGAIAARHGDRGLPEGRVDVRFRGSAGQSFGAFCVPGVRLVLEGEANDYVGKGMGGGEIVVRRPPDVPRAGADDVLLGNTVLYGATGGALWAAGRAGERFAVRNSGATAVVEGVGDHGCEYMTGGIVVVLGPTGRNFGAGMTGGRAFVLDQDDRFPAACSRDYVRIDRVAEGSEAETVVHGLVEAHLAATGSPRARALLEEWDAWRTRFWAVTPAASEPARAAVDLRAAASAAGEERAAAG